MPIPRQPRSLVLPLLLGCMVAPHARAQCAAQWSSTAPRPGLAGNGACATTWDPDGAGPLPERLVVGGENLIAGTGLARQRVITWDGTQWQSLGNGPGTTGSVSGLMSWNGVLVASGTFSGGGADYIAAWNGVTWQPLGAGLQGPVRVLGAWNGLVVAATDLTSAATLHTWNGVAWTTLPVPPQITFPEAILSYQGLLCVGGRGPAAANGALARWNGTNWLPTIAANNVVNCLGVRISSAVGGNDILYAGGSFTSINGTTAARIASTSGGASFAFSQVGNGLPDICGSLHVRPSGLTGTAVVATVYNAPGPLQLVGGAFVPLGTAFLSNVLRQGGSYYGIRTGYDDVLVRYDGTNWNPVRGAGLVEAVIAATRLGNDMIVGGSFPSISGVTTNNVALWDGATFTPLGAGLSGTGVDALLGLDNGDVIAGGEFTNSGSTTTNGVARWDGSAWSGIGSGVSGRVLALARMPNGDLIAGGTFASASGVSANNIARWNGATWSALGSGTNGVVRALAVRSDGRLFAGGSFTTAGGITCHRIAQWTGTAWQPVGTGCNDTVHAIAARFPGEIVAAGEFTTAGGASAELCARWTGTTWFPMNVPPGNLAFPRALAVLPSGDVLAGCGIHPVPTALGISRWDGGVWTAIGLGINAYASFTTPTVHTIVQHTDGSLFVGGNFAVAGGQTAGNLAVLSTPCLATSTAYGSGCSSAAGMLTITADSLPWIGAAFRTTTTGIAPGSLCLGLIGLTQLSIPLPTILAEGQPGCSLLTSLDILLSLTQGLGTATSSFALANDPSLIGVPFFQQTVPLEFDGTGALVAVRGSNGLAATIGTL